MWLVLIRVASEECERLLPKCCQQKDPHSFERVRTFVLVGLAGFEPTTP